MFGEVGTVLNRNACRNCRRPIYLLRSVGWLHAALPRYAQEEITCDHAAPVDPRCPHCDDLVPAASAGGGYVRLSLHIPSGMDTYCPGSSTVVERPR